MLDDIRAGAEGADGSFDAAQTVVKQAADEAGDLEQSAAGHGWAGVARSMASAQEALEAVASSIGSAIAATTESLAELSEITAEMSSDEVAARLAGVKDRLDSARTAASQAVDSLDDARTAAEQADAESLLQLIDSAGESLETGREAVAGTVTLVESEQSEAAAWGN